jgi:NADH-quinone oxidoreductase subunit E
MHSILQDQIASPQTPGTPHFAPFEATGEIEAEAARRIAQYPAEHKRSAVLPLLHLVQHHFGFISAEAIDWVAGKLELEPMRVLEVVTFYPGLRQTAPGKYHIRVCRTLSCAMGGSHELMEKLSELIGTNLAKMDPHHHPVVVSPCGRWSVEFAECLASCGTAPVMMVNDDFHEAVTPDKAGELLRKYDKLPG